MTAVKIINPAHTIYLIAAVGTDGSIGNLDGSLPWTYRNDLKIFRAKTVGQIVVMGRKTFESIGRPLADRTTVVQSRRNTHFYADGTEAITDAPLDLLQLCAYADVRGKQLWIAGGAEIYKLWTDWASQNNVVIEAHVTLVPFSGAAVKMPSLWQ